MRREPEGIGTMITNRFPKVDFEHPDTLEHKGHIYECTGRPAVHLDAIEYESDEPGAVGRIWLTREGDILDD